MNNFLTIHLFNIEESDHNSAPSSSCNSVDPVYLMLRAAAEARRNINQPTKPNYGGM